MYTHFINISFTFHNVMSFIANVYFYMKTGHYYYYYYYYYKLKMLLNRMSQYICFHLYNILLENVLKL